MVDGERLLVLSGSVHYTRVLPSDWDRVLKLAKVNHKPQIAIKITNQNGATSEFGVCCSQHVLGVPTQPKHGSNPA